VHNSKGNILRGAEFGQFAVNPNQHAFGLFLRQGLRRHDVLDFRGAYTKGQGAESAMGGRMAVAADGYHPRVDESVLGNDDMDHAVVRIFHIVKIQAVQSAIGHHCLDLFSRDRIRNRLIAVFGRHAMIESGQNTVWIPYTPVSQLEAFESLRAGDLVH
jgi:hypothetical protein